MRSIEFTQFLLPNGRQKQVRIDRPDDIAEMAQKLRQKGFSLEIENKDGSIWMSCVNHKTDEAVDEFCRNNWHVPAAVDKMIKEAAEKYL